MLDEEPRTLGNQFLAWGPNGVPRRRRVLLGGGSRLFGSAIVRRVQWSAGLEHLGEACSLLVGKRALQQRRECLRADADDLGGLVGGKRSRAVLVQGAFGPPDRPQLTVAAGTEPAAGGLRVGAEEVAAERVAADGAFLDRLEGLVGGLGAVEPGAGEQAVAVHADLLRHPDRHGVPLRWGSPDRHAVVEQDRDRAAAFGAS